MRAGILPAYAYMAHMRIRERETCWEYIERCGKPVFLYGMGNGADKIMDRLLGMGIRPAEVFASDDFVRGQSFRGYQVKRFGEVAGQYGDFVILLAFASERPEVMARIDQLDAEWDLRCPDMPVFGEDVFNWAYLEEHRSQMEQAYALLEEPSRRVFDGIVNYKLSGKLAYLREIHSQRRRDIVELIAPRDGDAYADLGAYDGDTIRDMEGLARLSHIYALEPDAKNFAKLARAYGAAENVSLYNLAAYDRATELAFDGKAGRNSALSREGRQRVPAESLDHLLAGRPVQLVKLDVEGAEAAALAGMEETIARWRPSMMVSAYHKTGDFFELPIFLAERGYAPRLRKHPYYPCWEVMVYCRGNI